MATVTITLKEPSKEKSPVVFQISDGTKIKFRVPANISVKTKQFSKTKKCVLPSNSDAIAINAFLRKRQKLITTLYLEFKGKGIIPTAKDISNAIKALETTIVKQEETKPTFWEYWEIFIGTKSNSFGTTYMQKYAALKKHLINFEKPKDNGILELDDINTDTFEKLQKYFFIIRNFNVQTTSKYLTMLKSFLRWCISKKFTNNNDYTFFTTLTQANTMKVIITPNELKLIRNLDLSSKPYLENVKKLFVLSCLTGLRFSDYTRIAKEHLKYDNDKATLLIRQKKTETFVEIPLTFESENLVKELISKEIRPISNQKMNDYVKELCQIAGLDESFEVHTTAGNIKKTEIRPKYELISSHTGRRTFATNLLSAGLSAITIMKYTGHSDYKSFIKYVNMPKDVENDLVRSALELPNQK